MSKVSIIVPIYNVEKYLPKCLDSLINQTFKDIEIWAISDGSPDNSVDIIKKYAKKDKRVKCIEKENGGYGSVLEYAIKNITSEYFIICDPDDWLREDAVEVLYNSAIKNKVDIVYGSYYFVYSDNKNEEYTKGNCYKNIFNPISNEVYKGLDKDLFWFMTPSPHAKLYKTKLAKSIDFPYKVSFTDWVLYTIYLGKAKSIIHLDEGLAYYLIDREGNTVTDIKPRVADYHNTVFKSNWNQYEEKIIEKDDLFYYRMFLQSHFILTEISKINDKNDFLEKRKLVYELFKICQSKSKQIKKTMKKYPTGEGYKRDIINKLLLNKYTSKCVFNYLSMRFFDSKHNK